MSINAKVCETYPEVAAAARDAGWEFMAHAYVQMPIQQIEDQRAVMRAVDRHHREIHRQAADRLARPGPRPDLRHARLRHRMRLHLVRRLGARRPAAVGEDRARPDPGGALQRRDQRHHHDGVAPPRIRRAAQAHHRRLRPALRGEQGVDAHHGDRRAPLRHRRRRTASNISSSSTPTSTHHGVVHWTGQQIYDWYAEQVPARSS